MPTQRAFSKQHGVALATATKVYAALERMGLVVGEVGRGTFVREWQEDAERLRLSDHRLMAAMPRTAPIDLAFNYPETPGAGRLLEQALQTLQASGGIQRLIAHAVLGVAVLSVERIGP